MKFSRFDPEYLVPVLLTLVYTLTANNLASFWAYYITAGLAFLYYFPGRVLIFRKATTKREKAISVVMNLFFALIIALSVVSIHNRDSVLLKYSFMAFALLVIIITIMLYIDSKVSKDFIMSFLFLLFICFTSFLFF